MQRNELLAGALAGWFCLMAPAFAQDTTASAEREESESNYKRLSVKLEQLEEGFRAQQGKIAKLVEENRTLRLEIENLKTRNDNAATQESIKQLKEKILEVDKKRIEDGELVTKRLAALGRDVSKTLTPKEVTPPPTSKNDDPDKTDKPDKTHKSDKAPASVPPEKSFTYKIKEGDTLNRIVTELRAQGYKITQKQVIDVNPNVNWSRLKIGQTVVIPPASP
jgi:TolA-binding protein